MIRYVLKLGTALQALTILLAALLMPWVAQAAQITAIKLEKSAQGDVLRIRSDAMLDFQSFDLNAPPRLLLQFPKSSLKEAIAPIKSKKSGVKSVAVSSSKSGVRLEIGLSKVLAYTAKQYKDGLVFRFAATASSKVVKANNAAVLKDITIRDRGDTTELVVRGEHMDASHGAFVTNKGRNLIVDFWGATSKLPKEHYSAATQKVSDVMVGVEKGRVRLVVKLLPGVSEKHQIDASKGQMVVRFGSVTPKRKAAEIQVQDVQFKAEDRIAKLMIRTNVSNPIVSLHEDEKNGAAIVDIRKAALIKGQERSQDVSDFSGPIKQVDAYKLGDKVRIVARLRDKVEISSFQQGNILTVTFVPKDIAAAKRGSSGNETFTYSGEKIDLNLQGIDIKNVLRLIADKSDMNFIMGDDVQGKINLNLVQVPWDQALDIILDSQGLGKEQQGNVMRIAPIAVLTKERQGKLAARKSEAELAPLITEFISLSFAKATEVKTMLEAVSANQATAAAAGAAAPAANSSAGSGNSMLSPRGSFVVDARTNTLIVKDTQASINNIKRLIVKIDQPVKQVLIEARIVEASDSFSREIGVRWGGGFNQATRSNFPGAISVGSSAANTSANADAIIAAGSTTGVTTRGFLVDLPAAVGTGAGGAIGLSLGSFNSLFNLD
ncbi:MAG: AMIN domain-containing protein, partial [Mariprofundaceae bacterium]